MKKTILVRFTDEQGKSVFINSAYISAIEEMRAPVNGNKYIVHCGLAKYGLNEKTFNKFIKHYEVVE